jgi:2-C-methyl-D-erythritol 2,4-cyclodiphosphate synthase
MSKIHEKGFRAHNVDVIVHAEAPKLSPYKQRMAASIAELVGVAPDCVSIKAKTNEGMGPLGHADGIACTAVAMVAPV